MDHLQAMATFVAVVDSSGFASAARNLNLSPPVVFGRLYVTRKLVDRLQRFPEVEAQCLYLKSIINIVEGASIWLCVSASCPTPRCSPRVGCVRRVLAALHAYLAARGVHLQL